MAPFELMSQRSKSSCCGDRQRKCVPPPGYQYDFDSLLVSAAEGGQIGLRKSGIRD